MWKFDRSGKRYRACDGCGKRFSHRHVCVSGTVEFGRSPGCPYAPGAKTRCSHPECSECRRIDKLVGDLSQMTWSEIAGHCTTVLERYGADKG